MYLWIFLSPRQISGKGPGGNMVRGFAWHLFKN